jgi:hypothetical protein
VEDLEEIGRHERTLLLRHGFERVEGKRPMRHVEVDEVIRPLAKHPGGSGRRDRHGDR